MELLTGKTGSSREEIGFGLIQTVYAVALVLGLEEAFDSIFSVILGFTLTLENTLYVPVISVLLLLLALTGIRMLAAATNLVFYAENADEADRRRAKRKLMAIHFPYIFYISDFFELPVVQLTRRAKRCHFST